MFFLKDADISFSFLSTEGTWERWHWVLLVLRKTDRNWHGIPGMILE